jgi:hypothetical protein
MTGRDRPDVGVAQRVRDRARLGRSVPQSIAVLPGMFSNIRFDLMPARLAPYDKANMGSGSVPEGHGWTGFGLHLTPPSPSRQQGFRRCVAFGWG